MDLFAIIKGLKQFVILLTNWQWIVKGKGPECLLELLNLKTTPKIRNPKPSYEVCLPTVYHYIKSNKSHKSLSFYFILRKCHAVHIHIFHFNVFYHHK